MSVAEHLTNSLYNDGIISEEERETVRFGLESLEGNLLGIVLHFVVGLCFGDITAGLLLWLWLFPLRKNAGGFHAQTKIRCFFISISMLVLSFSFAFWFEGKEYMYAMSCFASGGIIWYLAPVSNSSKKLDSIERKVYQKRARIVMVIEMLFLLLSLGFGCKIFVKSISMSFLISSTSMALGVLKNNLNIT